VINENCLIGPNAILPGLKKSVMPNILTIEAI